MTFHCHRLIDISVLISFQAKHVSINADSTLNMGVAI